MRRGEDNQITLMNGFGRAAGGRAGREIPIYPRHAFAATRAGGGGHAVEAGAAARRGEQTFNDGDTHNEHRNHRHEQTGPSLSYDSSMLPFGVRAKKAEPKKDAPYTTPGDFGRLARI
jgi:hypothetical protein